MGGDTAGLIVALLGPVEIGPAGGVQAPVPQPRLRVLLGLLGAAGGRMITTESLVAGVWGEEWSPEREKNLHALVYQLRRRLAGLEPGGSARLVRAGAGYRLALAPKSWIPRCSGSWRGGAGRRPEPGTPAGRGSCSRRP
jgi:DNA-binding SARP family transcriptional activator